MSEQQNEIKASLDTLPTPLVRAVEAWRGEDWQNRPFRAVHRLIDAIEVLCKIYTVAGVSHFIDVLEERLTEKNDPSTEHKKQLDGIRTMLASGLRTPSLGIWWGFARETAKALEALSESHILPDGIQLLTHKKSKVKKALDGNNNLITFRNSYAHGATPPDKSCLKDLEEQGRRFEELLDEAGVLTGITLVAVLADGKVWKAVGADPVPMEAVPDGLSPGCCYLLGQKGEAVNLHPLLVFDPLSGEDGKGAFFFYNDLRANHAALLNYSLSLHRRDKELRDVFLDRFPIDSWKKIGGAELDPFRERIEALTEVFKGRTRELEKLAEVLTETRRGFHVIWGPPGVGKSSLLARMIQLLSWSPELREQASPGISWPELSIRVVEYFIRRGSTDTAAKMLDSINHRLDTRFNIRMSMGTTDEERREAFVARLSAISKTLDEDQRLVLVIDGLDEARRDDPLLNSLPREVPDKILVLYGSRPQQMLRFGFYDELDRERRSCVDLAGLTLEDTRALLYAHVNKYSLEDKYTKAVLKRSEGNPLYLKLMCQGLEQGIYALNDVVKLPSRMEELYENALVRIENEVPGAVDLLTLLTAARDFISPAMAAELMNMSVAAFTAGPLSACMELLYENPMTEDLDDYQLFHESLREHLRESSDRDVRAWEEKLADWSANWKTEDGDLCHEDERLAYAMAFACPHLVAIRLRAIKAGRKSEAKRRGDQLLSLVEEEPWRAMCFSACGNGAPLQQSIRLAQVVVRSRDRAGSERKRLFRFARWIHDEPHRLYNAQRDQLRTPVTGDKARRAHLEAIVQLAQMGATPLDRVLLALTALWATPERPSELPQVLKQNLGHWLEEARNPALDKLWSLSKI